MVYRHYYLAREWVKMGHSVTIVAASYSHVRSRSPEVDRAVTVEDIDGIRYAWIRTPRYKGSSIGRVLNMLAFVAQFSVHWRVVVDGLKPDVVISSSTYHLDIFSAYRLARKHGARLVFDVRDLWPLTPITLGHMSRRNPLVLALQKAEDFGYRRADAVVSALPYASEYMQSRGMAPEKFCYVPNGIDPAEFETDCADIPELHQETLRKLHEEARLIVGFTGTHGLAHDLDTLIEAAEMLRSSPVRFALVGSGSQKQRLQEAARERQLPNIVFLPPVSKAEVPALLKALDVLYIGLKRGPMLKFGVSPHKLLDYMMAGKPVLHAIDTPNDMVSECQCGISIIPESPHDLADAVRRLMQMQRPDLERMGASGKEYVLKNHDYGKLARKFIDSVFQ